MKLPKLSIAAKLYTIFALLATATVALSAGGGANARQHHPALTNEFERALLGAHERRARQRADLRGGDGIARHLHVARYSGRRSAMACCCCKFNERIADGRRRMAASACGGADAAQFAEFEKRIQQFMEFRKELVRLGTEVAPAKGREWGDNEANRSVRTALNKDLDKLAEIYDTQRPSRSTPNSKPASHGPRGCCAMLAVVASCSRSRASSSSARACSPLADITRVTEQVAGGATACRFPMRPQDEIGALARSIASSSRR